MYIYLNLFIYLYLYVNINYIWLQEFFDLTPHMRKPQWKTIKKGIDMYIAKVYSDNKGTMKKQYFTLQGGPPAVEEIRRNPPPDVEPSVWEEHIRFYMKEENLARAAVNKENRKKNKVLSRHGSKSLAAIRHDYVRHILILWKYLIFIKLSNFNYILIKIFNYIKVINFNFIKVFKFN